MTREHHNSLIRQDCPKARDLRTGMETELEQVQDQLTQPTKKGVGGSNTGGGMP